MYPRKPYDCAADALVAHDALLRADKAEPRSGEDGMPIDPDAWLDWHTQTYQPAYRRWDAAMTELSASIGGVSRHPMNFRPICEQIVAQGPNAETIFGVAAMRER